MNKIPNFFIVGAAKSGTTSFHYYLNQHPEIFMSEQKETNYFVFKGQKVNFKGPGDDEYINKFSITEESKYLNLFKNVKDEKIIGESSPAYLYYHKIAAKNIKEFNKNLKIMIILRNPIERAYSQYIYFKKLGRETLEFKDVLQKEKERINNHWEWAWAYLSVGLYSNQVKTYLETFGKENVYIIILDKFQRIPLKHFKKIFNFLGVNNKFIPFFSYMHNVSIKNRKYVDNIINNDNDNIFKKIGRIVFPRKYRLLIKYKINLLNKPKMEIDNEIKKYLKEYYRDDIFLLSDIIKKDLSYWLKI